jgi:hypothetical protein
MFTATCADSKHMRTWLVGPHGGESAQCFMADLAGRLTRRIQRSTDSYDGYPDAVEKAFGWNRYDFATITKAAQGYNTSPAMACRLTDRVSTVEEMLSKTETSGQIAA